MHQNQYGDDLVILLSIILSAIIGIGIGYFLGKYKSFVDLKREAEAAVRDVTEISKNTLKTSRIFEVENTNQFRPITNKGSPYFINAIVLWHDNDELNISCVYKEGAIYRADPHPITIALNGLSYTSILEISDYLKDVVEKSRENA